MAPLLSSLASLYLLFAPPDSVIEPVEIQPPVAPTPSFERRSFTNDPIGVQQIVLDNGLTSRLGAWSRAMRWRSATPASERRRRWSSCLVNRSRSAARARPRSSIGSARARCPIATRSTSYRSANRSKPSCCSSSMASRSRPNSTDFRQLQGQIELWSRRGYVEDPRKALLDHYAKLEFADIEAFYAAQVAERPVIILVLGDPQRVDVGELARYGEVIEVRERELFAR